MATRNESVFLFVNPSEIIIESIVFIKSNFKTLNYTKSTRSCTTKSNDWTVISIKVWRKFPIWKKAKTKLTTLASALVTANDDASSHRLSFQFDYVNLMRLELNVLFCTCARHFDRILLVYPPHNSHFRIQFFRNWPRLEKQIALKFRHDGAITFGNDNSIGAVIWSTLSNNNNNSTHTHTPADEQIANV